MLVSLIVVLFLGLVCVGIGGYATYRDKKFRANATLVDAEVTGLIDADHDRYLTQYRFELDHHEVFGVLDRSTPRPITSKGARIPLLVDRVDPTQVRRLTTRRDSTLRIFFFLIGALMIGTAVPLLIFVA